MRWLAAFVALVSCTPAPAPASLPASTPTVSPAPIASGTVPPLGSAVPATARVAFPTLANAGAQKCSIRDAVLLGAHGEGKTVLAFRGASGIAAWKRSKTELAVRVLGLDGTTRGAPVVVPVAEGIEPYALRATEQRFDLLLRRWEWQHQKTEWWTLGLSEDGQLLTALTPLGSEQPRPRPEPAAPADALGFTVVNGAVPPPPGPGGRIHEAMGRPMLTRTLAEKTVGEVLSLEWRGNSTAHGIFVDVDIAWSGTHFIYPFRADGGGPTHDTYVARLLPVDCRP